MQLRCSCFSVEVLEDANCMNYDHYVVERRMHDFVCTRRGLPCADANRGERWWHVLGTTRGFLHMWGCAIVLAHTALKNLDVGKWPAFQPGPPHDD